LIAARYGKFKNEIVELLDQTLEAETEKTVIFIRNNFRTRAQETGNLLNALKSECYVRNMADSRNVTYSEHPMLFLFVTSKRRNEVNYINFPFHAPGTLQFSHLRKKKGQ
jgi:hypothetical protein